MSDRVRRYFDRRAAGYRDRFSRGVLGMLRRTERRALFRLLDAHAGERVLDAGSGPGLDATRLLELGCRVKAVDLSPAMVAEARRAGIDAEVGDLEHLELGETFARVLCAGCLEFCARPDDAIRSLAAHLAAGGRLVVLFPLTSAVGRAYRAFHRIRGVDARLFGLEEIGEALERAGLRVRECATATPFTALIAAEKAR